MDASPLQPGAAGTARLARPALSEQRPCSSAEGSSNVAAAVLGAMLAPCWRHVGAVAAKWRPLAERWPNQPAWSRAGAPFKWRAWGLYSACTGMHSPRRPSCDLDAAVLCGAVRWASCAGQAILDQPAYVADDTSSAPCRAHTT